jgi:purine-cytosine permease-like protein
MGRYGMPSGNAGWVRAVALLAVVAMVASVGYSALAVLQAPTWLVLALVALLVSLLYWLLGSNEDRS